MSKYISKRFDTLEEYTPGEQPRDRRYIKLNTNESPYPPSDGVLDALSREETASLNLYPDPTCTALRGALAAYYGVGAGNVTVTNGSDEALSFAFMAYCDGRTGCAFPEISYGFYPVFAQLYSLDALAIPLKDDLSIDPADYFGLGRTVFIANPNAPTGIALSLSQIEEILKNNPDNIVVIDEAYVDFGAQSAVGLTAKYPNLLVVGTYSKSRSMAGARLGFAIADAELIRDLEKIRYSTNPYNINRLTLVAGTQAVADAAYYEENCRKIAATRESFTKKLRALGFSLPDSKANFVFARFPGISGERIFKKLRERGFLVRRFGTEKIKDYLRITIGTPEDMDALCEALRAVTAELADENK